MGTFLICGGLNAGTPSPGGGAHRAEQRPHLEGSVTDPGSDSPFTRALLLALGFGKVRFFARLSQALSALFSLPAAIPGVLAMPPGPPYAMAAPLTGSSPAPALVRNCSSGCVWGVPVLPPE